MICDLCNGDVDEQSSTAHKYRMEALRLAVEASSISHKIDFEELADRYFIWLCKSAPKQRKKNAKSI